MTTARAAGRGRALRERLLPCAWMALQPVRCLDRWWARVRRWGERGRCLVIRVAAGAVAAAGAVVGGVVHGWSRSRTQVAVLQLWRQRRRRRQRAGRLPAALRERLWAWGWWERRLAYVAVLGQARALCRIRR